MIRSALNMIHQTSMNIGISLELPVMDVCLLPKPPVNTITISSTVPWSYPRSKTLGLDCSRGRRSDISFEFVTTRPEVSTSANRDTSVVVRELFANAEESVLVAGYAVHQGQRV